MNRAVVSLNALVFLLTVAIFANPGLVHADAPGRAFGLLTGFVSLSIAIADLNARREPADTAARLVMLGGVLLGLYAGNFYLLWAGAAAASVAIAYRAGWQPLVFAGSGIALALFGTLLDGLGNAAALELAFIMLLFGYGIQAMLVRYAPAALGGVVLNLPLIAILRFSHLLQAGPALIALGLAALLLAAIAMHRSRDTRLFFGLWGIALFAFGLGGTAAVSAGLLQMLLLTLIVSGLHIAKPGWLLGACLFALSALPPSGLFASEYIIFSQTIARAAWLAVPLGLGLLLCAIAILRAIGPWPRGKPKMSLNAMLAALHLALVFVIGFAAPGFLK